MHLLKIAEIVQAITYKPGWYIRLRMGQPSIGDRAYIQLEITEEAEASSDPLRKKPRMGWRGGKHYVSEHMCRQEIVGVVYGAIEAAELHEMREWFRYRGCSIYNPHLDPDVLVETMQGLGRMAFNVRANAMTMTELETK